MEKEIHAVPVLFTRGTHYEVGYNVGKTFGILIQDFLNDLSFYNKIALPLYELPEGKKEYENVLSICTAQYPQYVEEIRGMADGAGLPFYKLFILHVEHLLMADESALTSPRSDHGCTDIMINNANELLMGHTEDAYPECYGRAYILQAEIVDDAGKVVEQFSSISYPGLLPGYTMGFNESGMIHSINTVNPEKRNPNGTPREFLARALLGTKTLEEALEVLKNPGYGIADGFNLNIHFANQSGPKVIYSIEVGPGQNGKKESELDILEVPVGDTYIHCNRYVRLPIPNLPNFFAVSTDFRQQTLKNLPKAQNINDLKTYLSDTSNPEWPVYRICKGKDKGKTVMTGIFDTSNKTWSIYTGPAATTNPVAVLKMNY